MKFLIAGLGNIGAEYDATRHNIGFDVADTFVLKHKSQYASGRYAHVAEVRTRGKTFIVVKPTTFMNLSGKAVRYWLEKERILPANLLVVVDDLALPLGKLRLRAGGSHAGHNGLKHIDVELNTQEYARLRFGIGNDFPKGRQIDFVLSRWNRDELPIIHEKIPVAVEIIEQFAFQGISRTMSLYNR